MPLIRKDPIANSVTPAGVATPEDLKSPDSEIRWAAARQLAKGPSHAEALGEALAIEADPRIREALFTALVHIQTPEAVSFIVPHIRSQDAAIRAGTLDALCTMPQVIENQLPGLLADPDPDVRLLVCDIVRRLPGPIATKYLCDLLAHETLANVCGAAVEALSEVGDETALPVLQDCAARFAAEPFLVFSIKAVSRRIAGDGRIRGAQTP